ncbi:uncharacterized protein LOC116255620 [Nymphaea colorata]|nr:uncharacterized protein LOC116255620 [Nymphaea colorata]
MAEDVEQGALRLRPHEMGAFLESQLPCEFPYDLHSVLSSTESDEDEYMAGLTRRIAHCTLEEDDRQAARKVGAVVGSPQSTLCSLGSWSARSLDSKGSHGSSNGTSQVSSPTSTQLNEDVDGWDLLCDAAGQVARMRMSDDEESCQAKGLLGLPRRPPPVMVLGKPGVQSKTTNGSGVLLQRCWGGNHRDYAALSIQLEMLKQHRQQEQQQQQGWGRQEKIPQVQQVNSRLKGGTNGQRGRPPVFSSSAWPPLQGQSANTGMRAVFLSSNSGSKRGSSGTGVFLPRRTGNPADFKKKTGCSTVLLPARVVQALNLNIDGMGSARPSFYQGSLVHDPDGSIMLDPRTFCGRNGVVPPQRRTGRPHQPAVSCELRLPQEWTY